MPHSPSLPLRGETILLTRPLKSSLNLRDQLLKHGASVVHIPTVKLVALQPELPNLSETPYCALAFSSQNAWNFFLAQLEENDQKLPETTPRFSIGPATSEAMRPHGAVVEAKTRTGEGLAEAVWNHFGTTPEHPVLFPCSKSAHPTFATKMAERGIKTHRLELYEPQTCVPGPIPIEVSRPSWVLLTSPSAVEGFVTHLHPIENAKIICMGPTTQKAAEAAGLKITLVPDRPGTEELIEAMINYVPRA
jgi:uroporphyrinogen-III synthase